LQVIEISIRFDYGYISAYVGGTEIVLNEQPYPVRLLLAQNWPPYL